MPKPLHGRVRAGRALADARSARSRPDRDDAARLRRTRSPVGAGGEPATAAPDPAAPRCLRRVVIGRRGRSCTPQPPDHARSRYRRPHRSRDRRRVPPVARASAPRPLGPSAPRPLRPRTVLLRVGSGAHPYRPGSRSGGARPAMPHPPTDGQGARSTARARRPPLAAAAGSGRSRSRPRRCCCASRSPSPVGPSRCRRSPASRRSSSASPSRSAFPSQVPFPSHGAVTSDGPVTFQGAAPAEGAVTFQGPVTSQDPVPPWTR